MSAKNILITGPPGIGKTTLAKRLAERLRDDSGGFYTLEVRSAGQRTGFRIVTLDGEQGTLASTSVGSGPKVGRYTVNLDDLERIAIPSIHKAVHAGRTVIIDEVGRMELFSALFKEVVVQALESPVPVIATIRENADPFCDALKSRDDVELLHLSRENRETMADLVVSKLRAYLDAGGQ